MQGGGGGGGALGYPDSGCGCFPWPPASPLESTAEFYGSMPASWGDWFRRRSVLHASTHCPACEHGDRGKKCGEIAALLLPDRGVGGESSGMEEQEASRCLVGLRGEEMPSRGE